MTTSMDINDIFEGFLGGGRADKAEDAKLSRLVSKLGDRGWTPGTVAGWDEGEAEYFYRTIIRAGLQEATLPLAAVVTELAADRKPDTVRGIMYAVVSAGWLLDTSKKSYGRVQRILNVLRKRRVIPFDWIVDNVRDSIKPSSWTGLGDFADTVSNAYRMDFWARLPECVEIIVEKDTVAGRIAELTREYDVSLHPLRGYSSTTFAYAIASRWDQIEKPIHVFFVGDHDPSGRDIERAVQASLRDFCDVDFEWTRLAVTPDQFDEYDIIALEPKKKDARYKAFVAEYGARCAEVEAIPAPALRGMVCEAIESHIPQGEWARLKAIEANEKASWHEVMENTGIS